MGYLKQASMPRFLANGDLIGLEALIVIIANAVPGTVVHADAAPHVLSNIHAGLAPTKKPL